MKKNVTNTAQRNGRLSSESGAIITHREIVRRQNFARNINAKLEGLVSGDPGLQENVALIIWHGSLPLGVGGKRYDFDYAVFLPTKGASNLLEHSRYFVSTVAKLLPELIWRDDLHYDGASMFEAHTHWDALDPTLPHAGVHLYQESAINELLGKQTWKSAIEDRTSFSVNLTRGAVSASSFAIGSMRG